MKILNFEAENFKKLKVISIATNGNVVELTGKNRQGKSTVLDAIGAVFEGAGAIGEVPIRDGEKQAKIRVVVGDKEAELIITRKFKKNEKGEYLTSIQVEDPKGAVFKSPQALLDSLCGKLAFDPLAFVLMDKKAQTEAMKRLVPGVDFNAIESANRLDFEKRTDLNREAKTVRAQVAGLDIDITKERPVKVELADVQAELSKAQAHNEDVTRRKTNRENAPTEIADNRKRILEIQAEHAKIVAEIEAKQKEADKKAEAAAALIRETDDYERRLKTAGTLPELIPVEEFTRQTEAANSTNNAVLAWEKMDQLVKQAEGLESQAEQLTTAMADRTAVKEKAIREAKLPVDGLGLSEDGVTLNGLPFSQAASSEQIRTSVGVAMALNPKLRVIRVKDGSLLDEEGLALLAQMAEEKDYQIWIERVDSTSSVGFILEDGMLKGASEAQATPVAPVIPISPIPEAAPAAETPAAPKKAKPSKEL